MIKHLYFIRHGQTDFNRMGIVQGSGVDSSLNEVGIDQARRFFKHYQHIPFQAVLTSKLIRTHQTVAHFIASGVPHEQFEELNEMNWGTHEGQQPTPKMVAEYERLIGNWTAGNFEDRLTRGESAEEMRTRLLRFLEHLQHRPETHLLICTHGRTMRALVNLLRGESLRNMENVKHQNTGLYLAHLLEDGRFHLVRENDQSHLSDPLRD